MPFSSGDNSRGKRSLPQLVPTGQYEGKPPILLNRPVFQIGARESCRIRLMSSTVSQVHALLVQTRHLTYIRDLCSRAGVLVNEKRIRESLLDDGDILRIGRFEFIYRAPRRDHGEEPLPLPATLDVTGSPIPLPIEERVLLIGRRSLCDIPLVEESVSNAHAAIFQWESKRFVRDLGSRTGTFLNGEKIHEKELSPGDVIRVGETQITYNPSTEIASVDVIDSASESMIAAAPSAQELPDQVNVRSHRVEKPSRGGMPVTPDLVSLADTLSEPLPSESSHHDTAMIPLPIRNFPIPNASDTMGLDILDDAPKPVEEPPMPRSWRGLSSISLPILTAESSAIPEAPPVAEPVSGLPSVEAEPVDIAPVAPLPVEVEIPAIQPVEEATGEVDLPALAPVAPDADDLPPIEAAAANLDAVSDDVPQDDLLIPLETFAEPIELASPDVPVVEAGAVYSGELSLAEDSVTHSEIPDEPSTPIGLNASDVVLPDAAPIDDEPALEIADPMADTMADLPAISEAPSTESIPFTAVPVEDELNDLGLTSDLPSLTTSPAPSISQPEDELTDLGLTADLRDLPGNIPPVDLIAMEPPPAEAAPEIPDVGERPLIAETLDQPIDSSSAPLELSLLPAEEEIKFAAPVVAEPELISPHAPESAPIPSVTLSSVLDDALIASSESNNTNVEIPLNEPPLNEAVESVEVLQPADSIEGADLDALPSGELSLDAGITPLMTDSGALSDTTFGRQVTEFTQAATTGEIIEPNPDALPSVSGDNSDVPGIAPVDIGLEILNGEPTAAPDAPELSATMDSSVEGPEVDSTFSATPEPTVEETVSADDLALDALLESAEPTATLAGDAAIDAAVDVPAMDVTPASSQPVIEETVSADDLALDALLENVEPAETLAGDATIDAAVDVPAMDASSAPEAIIEETVSADDLALDALLESAAPTEQPLEQIDLSHPADESLEREIQSTLSGSTDSPALDLSAPTGLSGHLDSIAAPLDLPAPEPRESPGVFELPSDVVLPPRPRRDKPAVIRNFGRSAGSADAPFAGSSGEAATIGDFASTGAVVDDVFGRQAPPLDFAAPDVKPRDDSRPPAQPPAPVVDFAEIPSAYLPVEAEPEDAALRRKRLLKRVPVVAVLGAVLAVGLFFAALKFVPVFHDIQMPIRFENLHAQSQRNLLMIQQQQKALLNSTREESIRRLREQYPMVAAGFLLDDHKFYKTVGEARWSDQQPGTLMMKHTGIDSDGDSKRMLMIAASLYAANAQMTKDFSQARDAVRDAERQVDRGAQRLKELDDAIEKDRLLTEKYEPEKLIAAAAQVEELEKSYNAAIASLKGVQAEIDRLKKSQPADPQGAAPDPANDEELTKLARQADELSTRLATARAEREGLAKQARESLDAAYEQFQKQIASAEGNLQQSPELARFVTTAQDQLRSIRELTDQFIASQQAEYQQLEKTKTQLDEKMQTRRKELWARDEQLQQLAERREITVRKINAAKSDGIDVSELQNELTLTENVIKARQEVLTNDPLYADVINTLQQLIEQKQRQMVEDRKKTDEKLATLQRQFTASLPAVEKLPQEQQALAADLKKRLAEVDAARRQYASAADVTQNDVVIKSLTEQLSNLQGDIEVRRQQLAAATNGAASKQLAEQIAAKEKELETLQAAHDKTEQAFFGAQAQLRDVQQIRTESQSAKERLDRSLEEKTVLARELTERRTFLKSKSEEVARAVRPVQPQLSDITVPKEHDYRMISAIGGTGGMLALTALICGWLLYAAAHTPVRVRRAMIEEIGPDEESREIHNSDEDSHPATA